MPVTKCEHAAAAREQGEADGAFDGIDTSDQLTCKCWDCFVSYRDGFSDGQNSAVLGVPV